MTPGGAETVETSPGDVAGGESRVLYDGVDLADWELGVYGESDEYEVNEEGVIIPQTAALAGMTYRGELPETPYVLGVEATRLYGADFFLGLTFPAGEDHLTLVLGGWGGMVCGLSSIDGVDASSNDTRTLRHFPNGKRHAVVVTVTETEVDVTIDGEPFLTTSIADRELGLRVDVEPSFPLGIASYATSTQVHRVWVRERDEDPGS